MLAAEPGGWQGTAAPAGPGSPGGERGGRSAGRDGGGGKLQVTPALRRSGVPAQVAGSPLRNREHILPEGLAARPAFGRGIASLLAVPGAVTLQPKQEERAGEGNLSFQRQTVPSFCLMSLSLCVCSGRRSLLSHPPLSPCQGAAGREQGWQAAWFPRGIYATWWH